MALAADDRGDYLRQRVKCGQDPKQTACWAAGGVDLNVVIVAGEGTSTHRAQKPRALGIPAAALRDCARRRCRAA